MHKKVAATFSLAFLMVLGSACAHRVRAGYRAYDPVYSDYHTWSPDEAQHFSQWETETHRQQRDYKKLKPEDQRAYWQWRHSHPDQH